MHLSRTGLAALASATLGTLVLAQAATAARAPGVSTFPLDPRPTVDSVDLGAPFLGAARPDGGAVLAGLDRPTHGLVLAGVRADGTLDPAFGTKGLTGIAVSADPTRVGPAVTQVLRDGEGRYLVVWIGRAASPTETGHLVVARVTAGGALDPTYGDHGIADTGIEAGCGGACTPAALASDGSSLLLTGQTGSAGAFTWVVTRLTPQGAVDQGYGTSGVVSVTPGKASGFALSAGPAGTVAVLGNLTNATTASAVVRLTAAGAVDPTFNGGQPADVPFAFNLLARPDGSIDVASAIQGPPSVARLTPAGVPDTTFGDQGVLALDGFTDTIPPTALVTTADGAELAVGNAGPVQPGLGAAGLRVQRLGATGADGAPAAVALPFGGGLASVFAVHRAVRVTPLAQTGYLPGRPIPRAGGGLLVPGSVGVVQYTGEGEGYSHQEEALVGLTSGGALDPSVGGPASPAKLAVKIPSQRASSAASTKLLRIAVDATTSSTGLAILTVHGRGRLLAHSTAPVLRVGTQRLRALLTPAGRRYLRHAHGVRVTVDVRFRDLVGQGAHVTARGTLR